MHERALAGAHPSTLDALAVAGGQSYGNTAAGRREAEAAQTGRTRIEQRGLNQRTFMGPLREGESLELSPEIAEALGIPQYRRGGVRVSPGDKVTMPNGETFAGPPKPLTQSEVIAQVLQQLPQREQRAAALGSTPVETVQTPEGPRIAWRADAIGQPAAPRPETASELSRLQQEREAVARQNPNDPRVPEFNQRIQALGRGQSESTYTRKMDEALVEESEAIRKNATSARSNLDTIVRIEQLLAGAGRDQGKWAGARLEVRRALNALGVDAGDTSPLEVAQGLSNKFALIMRDPSSGAGMPGALSDADRRFLSSMSTNIENSPQANAKIVDYFKRLQQRSLDVERMRQDYVRRHGRIDEGFRSEVTAFADTNPLFPDAPAATPPAGANGFRILKVE